MKLTLPRSGNLGTSLMPRVRPQAVVSAAALLAPVLAVQLARLVFSGVGPQAASAVSMSDTAPGAPAAAAPGLPRLTPSQTKAMEWINTSRVEPMPASPLLRAKPVHASAVAVAAPSPVEAPKPEEAKIPEALTRLELTSVMRAGGGAAAMINGRMFRVGDVVTPGWTLTDIAFAERRVSLKNEAGLEVYLSQNE